MRAICVSPASPLGENDFFRNQTGKLGKDCFDNDSVSCLLKRHGNATYLLTVNSTFEKVRARFRLANVPATAEVMRENRKVTVSAGLLEDDFEPFAVHVYRFN